MITKNPIGKISVFHLTENGTLLEGRLIDIIESESAIKTETTLSTLELAITKSLVQGEMKFFDIFEVENE